MGRDDRGASLRDGATNDDAVAANAAKLAARNQTINGIIVSHARINRPRRRSAQPERRSGAMMDTFALPRHDDVMMDP